jgi:hypothetical protein
MRRLRTPESGRSTMSRLGTAAHGVDGGIKRTTVPASKVVGLAGLSAVFFSFAIATVRTSDWSR